MNIQHLIETQGDLLVQLREYALAGQTQQVDQTLMAIHEGRNSMRNLLTLPPSNQDDAAMAAILKV